MNNEPIKSKFQSLVSQTGSLCRFRDYNFPTIQKSQSTGLVLAIPSIRVAEVSNSVLYFFHLEMASGSYNTYSSTIEYSAFKEMYRAFTTLKESAEKEDIDNIDYLENHYSTEDGFKIGYYVSQKAITWFLRLDRFSSESSLYLEVEEIENLFANAQQKFNELGA